MFRYLVKRLLLSIVVLFGVSVVIFCLVRILPGDPARVALGERATEEALTQLRSNMHLDEPIYAQYYYWIVDALHGDFGMSVVTKHDVHIDIVHFLPATLELVLTSAIYSMIFSTLFGVLAAKYKNKAIDGIIRTGSYIAISIPPFVVAALLLLLFGSLFKILPVYDRLSTGVAPPDRITGLYVVDYLLRGNLKGVGDALKHLILPAAALSLGCIGQESRILRSSMIDNMSKEYISVSTGFGIPQGRIMSRYLFKPSCVPMITVMGLDIASQFGNAFLVEYVFNWPGLSKYCLNAMLNSDINAISACVLIIGVMFTFVNIIVDLINAAVDPRVRLGD